MSEGSKKKLKIKIFLLKENIKTQIIEFQI